MGLAACAAFTAHCVCTMYKACAYPCASMHACTDDSGCGAALLAAALLLGKLISAVASPVVIGCSC
jgi:hypothetical protein